MVETADSLQTGRRRGRACNIGDFIAEITIQGIIPNRLCDIVVTGPWLHIGIEPDSIGNRSEIDGDISEDAAFFRTVDIDPGVGKTGIIVPRQDNCGIGGFDYMEVLWRIWRNYSIIVFMQEFCLLDVVEQVIEIEK